MGQSIECDWPLPARMKLSDITVTLAKHPALRRLFDRIADTDATSASVLEAAKPAVIAALYYQFRRPVAVVTARSEHARRLADQTAAWVPEASLVRIFPASDALPYEMSPMDPLTAQDRLRVLEHWRRYTEDPKGVRPGIVVASAHAAIEATVPPARLRADTIEVEIGTPLDPAVLLDRLVDLGYEPVVTVELPGTFARRGGIVDVFPAQSDRPVRIEFFGDEVDSLRLFDGATQRSIRPIESCVIGPAAEQAGSASLTSYIEHLPPDGILVIDDPEGIHNHVEELDQRALELRAARLERGDLPPSTPRPYLTWDELQPVLEARRPRLILPFGSAAGSGELVELPFSPAPLYAGRIRSLQEDVRRRRRLGDRILVVTQQSGRLSELLEGELPPSEILHGSLAEGWILDGSTETGPDLMLLTDAELFGISKPRRVVRQRPQVREALTTDFQPGEFVVHVDHGIGRYVGMHRRTQDGVERDYLLLEYAEGDKLWVPAEQIDRVSRYIGGGDGPPHVTRLGTQDWHRTKERAKRSVREIVVELLNLYAARELVEGYAFPADNAWQQEMEAAFPYIETPDQLSAIRATKQDMEQPKPMDRLVCGDVGYGKTEVAIRAAFKAVMGGRQVAVLVPTTVLAQQHYETFKERFAPFPVRVEMLSRFRSEKAQRAVLEGLADGSVDVCIGTHRLIQKDVRFKNLGLLIIDEEQRFGVAHKERLKEMRAEVDVLTMTATPIPRTLHMALTGIRDMSTIETPPEDRLPIKTYVGPRDEGLIRQAILRELDRDGQIYFVHNRVQNIELVAREVCELVPEARVLIGHGQMPEEQLERVMADFAAGKADVLVCTTIIESGLDIPNVNTIIINNAHMFGLSQLYQLRGRVGRSANRAYAYLFYPRDRSMTEQADLRLRAIFESSDLGAGFRIAMKDLEIRGAGNLLGAEQSGHIAAVGFDLYTKMLAQAVDELKRRKPEDRQKSAPLLQPEVTLPPVDIPIPAYLPSDYIEDMPTRLAIYQRLAMLRTVDEVNELASELADRFGEPPEPVKSLLYIMRLRALAKDSGVQGISIVGDEFVVQFSRTAPKPLQAMARYRGSIRVSPTQIRLARASLRDRWRAALQEVLEEAAAGPALAPAR